MRAASGSKRFGLFDRNAKVLKIGKVKSMHIRHLIAATALTSLISVAANAQDKTEPVATDSEGVSPEQQAKTEKKKANEKKTQTWGGGPKSGALHEDWIAWINLVSLKPELPTPKFPTGTPAPSDPAECAIKIQDYRTTPHRDEMGDEDWDKVQSGYDKAMNVYCKPG